MCCYQSVKDKNFESNSQLVMLLTTGLPRCYQSVKDKNFESNSQLSGKPIFTIEVVISLSKIKISKAIHNDVGRFLPRTFVVISLSKIKISKAIHNYIKMRPPLSQAVISLSKIKISKKLLIFVLKITLL